MQQSQSNVHPLFAGMCRAFSGDSARDAIKRIDVDPLKCGLPAVNDARGDLTAAEVAAITDDELQAIPAQVAEVKKYVELLQRQDFDFERADDAQAYRRGRDSLNLLRDLQRRYDPSGSIWNSVVPSSHRIGVAGFALGV